MNKRKKYLDSGLFVTWKKNMGWVRMKDTNLVYRLPDDTNFFSDWYMYQRSDTSEYESSSTYTTRLGYPRYLIDLTELFGSYRGGRYLKIPTSEVISILLEGAPSDLQTKILFNINLFKD